MTLLHPSLERALLAYGAGATLAGALTFALGLGDAWSLLGSGAGALIVAGALRLLRRTFAMEARILKELEFRRIVLGIGTLAAVFGTVVFVLAMGLVHVRSNVGFAIERGRTSGSHGCTPLTKPGTDTVRNGSARPRVRER